MKKKNLITLVVLIALSLLVAVLSKNEIVKSILILIFAIKFILVSFSFMEMKHAHTFWKTLIILFITILFSILLIMKNSS